MPDRTTIRNAVSFGSVMDDPKHPSSRESDSPDRPVEGELLPLRPDPDDVIETGAGSTAFSSEPVRELPDLGPTSTFNEAEARIASPAPKDHLPGDAALDIIPLKSPAEAEPAAVQHVMIDEPMEYASPDVATARPPRQGLFTVWAIVWVALWAGGMWLLLDHRLDRKFDWNTSYFSIAARNLVRDGFAASHGGVYLTAGDFKGHRSFYAGHPPLTAWLLYGWMKTVGDHERMIRALPLAFSALNLLLLYALVRRVFGAPAALAATILCSLLPMTAYYAQVVNMEPFVLTFMLGASLGYLGWARSSSRVGFGLLVVCVILGCWTDWPMYVFTGFLAVLHFVRRRDGLIVATPDGGETVEKAGRPVMSTLFLLLLPVVMFGVFWGYVKLNGADLSELTERAADRMTASADATARPTNLGGYATLLKGVRDGGHLKDWFINLFTPAALVLATLGALLWPKWTRRLSLASGEAGRRAAFRIVLALLLTQLTYTLAFPQGAYVHEFWQYYLAVPVAVLAAGFCTWLTVAGGTGRRFQWGLADRAAWAVAALIPLLAAGPFTFRMHVSPPWKKEPVKADFRVDPAYVDALRNATDARDVILTDWNQDGVGFAMQWYADRIVLPYEGEEQDTRSLAGIEKIRQQYKDRRILYLWGDGDGSEQLFESLTKQFKQRPAGPIMLYVISEPGGGPIAVPPTTAPAAAATTSTSTTRPLP